MFTPCYVGFDPLLQAADQTAGITDPKKLAEMEKEAVVSLIEHMYESRPFCSTLESVCNVLLCD